MEPLKEIPEVNKSSGVTADFFQEMPEYLRQVAEQVGAIAKFKILTQSVNLVSDPALVREVLVTRAKEFPKADRDVSILSRFIGDGLVTTQGEIHKRQRKMSQPAFHAGRIGNYAETMADYSQKMMTTWQNGEIRDLSEEMMALTMFVVSKTLFDTDMEQLRDDTQEIGEAIDQVQALSDEAFDKPFLWPLWIPTRMNRKTWRVRRVLDRTVMEMVKARRAEAIDGQVPDRGDLLSMLMLAEDENGEKLTDVELRDQLLTLFVAGHETTSNALTWTWYLLSQHPDIEARMHAEIDTVLGGRAPSLSVLKQLPYVEMVLKESMRMLPPVWSLNARAVTEDTHIGPYRVKKGEWIFVSPYAIQRNSRLYPEPLRFDPERFSPENEKEMDRYAYLPFGAGPRVCIGQSFAMMEAHLILAAIGQRYRFELMPDQKIDLNARITLSNKGGMHMRLVDRKQEASLAAIDNADLVLEPQL